MAFFFLVLIFFTFTTTPTIATKTNDNQKPKVVQKHFLGVDPLFQHEYSFDDDDDEKKFACNDGKTIIDFTKVNDNFCDCREDGSDEPGTNACSHAIHSHGFYCQNLGSTARLIKSSFVNDNVCDCCDGSDEKFNTKKHCENTCSKDGMRTMESLREEVRDFEIGIRKKRNEYAKKMENAKKEAEKEVVRLQKAVEQLREEKEKNEAEEEKANEVFREKEKLKEEREEEEERKKKQEEEKEKVEEEEKRHHHPDDESKEEREMREMEEEMREIEREEGEVDRAAAKVAASDNNDEKKGEEDINREETDEERGRRIAEQWVHGDDNDHREGENEEEEDFIDGDYGHHDPYEEEDDYDEDGHYSPHDDDDDDFDDDDDDNNIGEERDVEASKKEKVGMFGRVKQMVMGNKKAKKKARGGGSDNEDDNKMGEEERALEDARKVKNEASRKANEAREKFEESNAKLSAFNAKIERLSSETDDETTKLLLGALSDQCFSTKADKYTYEICLFGQSKQDNHVRLGDMKSEITFDDLSGKRFAKFENGEKCWNGPKRSMTVELVCGSTESLFDVQEPSRCEYSSKLYTPIACDEKTLDEKKIELDSLAEREKNTNEEAEVEYVVNF